MNGRRGVSLMKQFKKIGILYAKQLRTFTMPALDTANTPRWLHSTALAASDRGTHSRIGVA